MQCSICQSLFKSIFDNLAHQSQQHGHILKYLRGDSPASTLNPSDLDVVQCDLCKLLFKSKVSLNLHKGKMHRLSTTARLDETPPATTVLETPAPSATSLNSETKPITPPTLNSSLSFPIVIHSRLDLSPICISGNSDSSDDEAVTVVRRKVGEKSVRVVESSDENATCRETHRPPRVRKQTDKKGSKRKVDQVHNSPPPSRNACLRPRSKSVPPSRKTEDSNRKETEKSAKSDRSPKVNSQPPKIGKPAQYVLRESVVRLERLTEDQISPLKMKESAPKSPAAANPPSPRKRGRKRRTSVSTNGVNDSSAKVQKFVTESAQPPLVKMNSAPNVSEKPKTRAASAKTDPSTTADTSEDKLPFKCNLCPMKYGNKLALNFHIKCIHEMPLVKQEPQEVKNNNSFARTSYVPPNSLHRNNPKIFQECSFCKKKYTHAKSLARHKLEKHGFKDYKPPPPQPAPVNDVDSEESAGSTKSSLALRIDTPDETSSEASTPCSSYYGTLSEDDGDEEAAKFACNFCQNRYSTSEDLDLHKRQEHDPAYDPTVLQKLLPDDVFALAELGSPNPSLVVEINDDPASPLIDVEGTDDMPPMNEPASQPSCFEFLSKHLAEFKGNDSFRNFSLVVPPAAKKVIPIVDTLKDLLKLEATSVATVLRSYFLLEKKSNVWAAKPFVILALFTQEFEGDEAAVPPQNRRTLIVSHFATPGHLPLDAVYPNLFTHFFVGFVEMAAKHRSFDTILFPTHRLVSPTNPYPMDYCTFLGKSDIPFPEEFLNYLLTVCQNKKFILKTQKMEESFNQLVVPIPLFVDLDLFTNKDDPKCSLAELTLRKHAEFILAYREQAFSQHLSMANEMAYCLLRERAFVVVTLSKENAIAADTGILQESYLDNNFWSTPGQFIERCRLLKLHFETMNDACLATSKLLVLFGACSPFQSQ